MQDICATGLSKAFGKTLVPVYLKVTDPNPGQYGGHTARLEVDYAVVNGQQIPLKTAAGLLNFGVPTPNPRRRIPTVDTIMPEGRTQWWDIIEQVEVSTAGLSADQLKKLVPPPDRASSRKATGKFSTSRSQPTTALSFAARRPGSSVSVVMAMRSAELAAMIFSC